MGHNKSEAKMEEKLGSFMIRKTKLPPKTTYFSSLLIFLATILIEKTTQIENSQPSSDHSSCLNLKERYQDCPLRNLTMSRKRQFLLKTPNHGEQILAFTGYTAYKPTIRESSGNQKQLYDAYQTFLVCTPSGVFRKELKHHWLYVNEHTELYPTFMEMESIFKPHADQRIEKCYMEVDSRKVIMVDNDLNFTVIEIKEFNFSANSDQKLEEKKFEIFYNFSLNETQKRYEDGDRVYAIARLPESQMLVMSRSRFEFFKFDLNLRNRENFNKSSEQTFKNMTEEVFESTIDEIRLIVVPHKLYQFERLRSPLMVMTSLNDNMNVMLDYSSMKPLRYFSIALITSNKNSTKSWSKTSLFALFFSISPTKK